MDRQLKAMAEQIAQLKAQNEALVTENGRLRKGYGLSKEAVSLALAIMPNEEFTAIGLAELEDYKKLQRNHEKVKETNAKYRRGDVPGDYLSVIFNKLTTEELKEFGLVKLEMQAHMEELAAKDEELERYKKMIDKLLDS